MYTTPSWWPLLSSQRVRMAGTGKSVNSVSGRRSHQVASAERALQWAQELAESGQRLSSQLQCLMPILDISALSIIYAVCTVLVALG